MAPQFDLRRDAAGWTVFDRWTGQTVIIEQVRQEMHQSAQARAIDETRTRQQIVRVLAPIARITRRQAPVCRPTALDTESSRLTPTNAPRPD